MPIISKKATIGGKLFDVCDCDTYIKNKETILADTETQTAVEVDFNGKKALLPIRGKSKSTNIDRPGVYDQGGFDFLSYPKTPEEEKEYCPDPDKVFDLSDIKNMQDLINKKEKFDNITNQILETSDKITKPPFKEKDTPAMRGLKMAVAAKNADLDNYQERFGENYPNDKRKLNDTDATLFIISRVAKNLDMEVDITFRDAPGNIANPMNKEIKVNIVPGNTDAIEVKDAT